MRDRRLEGLFDRRIRVMEFGELSPEKSVKNIWWIVPKIFFDCTMTRIVFSKYYFTIAGFEMKVIRL